MTDLIFSRALTGTTLGFHIIFATLGVGIPVLLSLAELLGILKKDSDYILLAKRWSKGFVILVAVGVVTGTVIGFQLNLLWPTFMKFVGEVISFPFMMEAFAFFLEAIFLGIWLYTWGRFKNPWIHWLFSLPIILGSSASAALITTVNAFMNAPQGFTIEHGKLTHVDPLMAILNPATPTKLMHVLSSAYFMTAIVMAALTAFFILKRKNNSYYRKALTLTMTVMLVTSITTAIAGDLSGKYLAHYQPEKLAAAEALFDSQKGAPLLVGGVIDSDTQTVRAGIELPNLLSFLATGSFNGEVKGLNDFPRDEQPPVFIHYLFDTMVAAGSYAIFVGAVYLFLRWRKHKWQFSKPMLWAVLVGGPVGIVGLETGWIFSEIGRKPWIIYKVMRVEQAVTTMGGINHYFYAFCVLYLVIGVMTSLILVRFFRKRPVEAELAAQSEARDNELAAKSSIATSKSARGV